MSDLDTQFAVTIPMTVLAFDREWPLKATVSPRGWECEPVILWLERDEQDVPFFVPGQVWDLAQAQLDDMTSLARIQFEHLMNRAPIPFMAAAE